MKLLDLMKHGALTTAARENSKNSENSNSRYLYSDTRNNSQILKKNKNSNNSNNSSYSYSPKEKSKAEAGMVATAILANLATDERPLPFLDLDGSLFIPFGADPRFHWWNGGQSIQDTEKEVRGLLN